MAYTAPTERAAGFLVTASVYNVDIIRNIVDLRTGVVRDACWAYHSAIQAVTADAALNLNSEDADVGGMHSTVSNTSRLTVPTGEGGLYFLLGRIRCTGAATGTANAYIRKNNTTNLRNGENVSGTNVTVNVWALEPLAAGDYVELYIDKSDGSSWDFGGTDQLSHTTFMAVRVRDSS